MSRRAATISLDNLPDPKPQTIVLRYVGYRDPGFVIVTADGTKIDEIDGVTDDPGFKELCAKVVGLGYIQQPPSYIDMGLIVLAFTLLPQCRVSASGNCLAESQSETGCVTEEGECVHGGQS